eukprot:gene31560-6747_t
MAYLYRTELQQYDQCAGTALKAMRAKPSRGGPPRVSHDNVYVYTIRSEVCSCGLYSKAYVAEGFQACEDLLARLQAALSQGQAFGNIQEMLELMMRTATTLQMYNTKRESTDACLVSYALVVGFVLWDLPEFIVGDLKTST